MTTTSWWFGGHRTGLSTLAPVITGGVSSSTVTLCVAEDVLPLPSVAVWVTMVVPTGKKLPAGTPLRVTVTEQLSLAVAIPKTVSLTNAPHEVASGPVATVTSGGAVTVGGVWSTTVTIAMAEFVTPRLSVAMSLTVC